MAKAKTAPTCRALPDIAGQLVSAEGMPSASNINGLDCQTSLKARFDTQRVFPALSNHIIERDDGRYQIGAVRMTARLQAISVAIPATTTTTTTTITTKNPGEVSSRAGAERLEHEDHETYARTPNPASL